MSVTGSPAPADVRHDPPVPPSWRRPRLLACIAALLAAGALLLPSAAAAAAPTRAGAPGPSAAKPADELMAVSCPTDKMCVAVGESSFSSTGTMLAERWNGHTWSVTRLAHPPGATNSFLTGVSCTSARACTAVGVDFVPATGGGPLAERWNGSRWTLQVTPNPGQSGVRWPRCRAGRRRRAPRWGTTTSAHSVSRRAPWLSTGTAAGGPPRPCRPPATWAGI